MILSAGAIRATVIDRRYRRGLKFVDRQYEATRILNDERKDFPYGDHLSVYDGVGERFGWRDV
jgi:hypothetical protein